MKRTKLADRVLPDYTRGEEIFNMVSHIVGGALAVAALLLCVIFAAARHNPWGIGTGIVYGITMIVLYTMSSVYHGLSPRLGAKKVFQVIDHCAIFLLIAGTYTPYTLCVLRPDSPKLGWGIFALVWGVSVLGIVLNAIDLDRFAVFSMVCYLGLGWCIIAAIKPLVRLLHPTALWLLVAGGIAYTVGAVAYGVGNKVRYMHSVFHLFVVAGSVLHFLSILLYVM